MRIKVKFKIFNEEISEEYRTNIYNHQIYSMLLNTLDRNCQDKIHNSINYKRPFCFSDLFINIEDKEGHFYICGEDYIVEQFKLIKDESQELNNLIYKGNKLKPLRIKITCIENDKKIKKQKEYIFKTKFIVNIPKDVGGKKKRPRLLEDNKELEIKLRTIALQKAIERGIINKDDNVYLDFKIIHLNDQEDKRKCCAVYKEGYKISWKARLEVKGDFKLIKFIYDVAGVGENTASGHGFVFLDRRYKNVKR